MNATTQFYRMLAGEYHAISVHGEAEARRLGKIGENSDPIPAWDEAFVYHDGAWREIWDISKDRDADGMVLIDVGPCGRTIKVDGCATVKVR